MDRIVKTICVIVLMAFVFSISNVMAKEIKGTYLKNEYISIPSFTKDKNGEIQKHIDAEIGTIEFWFKPDWKLANKGNDKNLFFWGKARNNNSIAIFKTDFSLCCYMWSKKYQVFALRIKLWEDEARKAYDMNPSVWHHVAVCWDFTDVKKTVLFFLDGKNVSTEPVWKDRWAKAETEFDGIESDEDMYIGLGKLSDGDDNYKSGKEFDTSMIPEFEIAQFCVSDTLKYDSEFEPKQNISPDKNTLIFMAFDGLNGAYYKDGKKAGEIKAKQLKIEK